MKARIVARAGSMVVLGALLLGGTGDLAVAAKTPIEVQDSAWLTSGILKFVGIPTPFGPTIPAQAFVQFGPLPGPGLPGSFNMGITFAEGSDLQLVGTYAEPKAGKPVLFVNLLALQEEFGSPSILVQQATVKAKTKSVVGLDTLGLNVAIKLRLCEEVDGKLKCKNAKIGYKGSGTRIGP